MGKNEGFSQTKRKGHQPSGFPGAKVAFLLSVKALFTTDWSADYFVFSHHTKNRERPYTRDPITAIHLGGR